MQNPLFGRSRQAPITRLQRHAGQVNFTFAGNETNFAIFGHIPLNSGAFHGMYSKITYYVFFMSEKKVPFSKYLAFAQKNFHIQIHIPSSMNRTSLLLLYRIKLDGMTRNIKIIEQPILH